MDPKNNQPSVGELNDFGGTVDELDTADYGSGEIDRGDVIEDTPETEDVQPEDTSTSTLGGEPEDTDTPEEDGGEGDQATDSDDASDSREETPVGNKIPYDRFKKESEKRKAAEEKLYGFEEKFRLMQEQLDRMANTGNQEPEPEPAEPEVDLNAELTEALNGALDGNVAEAATKIAELIQKTNAKAVKDATKSSTETIQTMTAAEKAQALLNEEANRLVAEYDVLNKESDNFDSDILQEVLDIRDAFIAKGEPGHLALKRASDITLRLHGISGKQEQQKQEQEQETPPQKDIKKNVEAAIKTPPRSTGELETGKTRRSIEEIPEAEFEKLSEEDLRRLRGDIL